MTFFHVYLPPPISTAATQLDHLPDGPLLKFKQLHPPLDEVSQSQSSLSQRIDRLQRHVRVSNVNVHEEPPSSVTKRRRSGDVTDRNHCTPENEASSTRRKSRRSQRLRTNASLLGTLPQAGVDTTIDISDSYSSLNTTDPTFSQLPPTAQPDQSLSHLPQWRIPLSRLTTLSTLLKPTRNENKRQKRPVTYLTRQQDKQIVSVIVCVMSVETPVVRQRKDEKRVGKEGSLWIGSWTVTSPPIDGEGDEVGCKVKLWESCARDWGDDVVRKGDVILLENVEYKPSTSKDPAQLILSPTPNHTPTPTILYRTLPRYTQTTSQDYIYPRNPGGMLDGMNDNLRGTIVPEDRALRPDLRLGRSDAGVRKVAEIARWFADWVGGEGPH